MKAILVIEMQSGCLGCPCYRQTYNDDWEMVRETCEEKLMPLNDTEVANRPKWCPLKPLPQRKTGDDLYERYGSWTPSDEKEVYYRVGFNDCLDEITGETE